VAPAAIVSAMLGPYCTPWPWGTGLSWIGFTLLSSQSKPDGTFRPPTKRLLVDLDHVSGDAIARDNCSLSRVIGAT